MIDAFLKIAKMAEYTGVDFWDNKVNANHTLKAAVDEMIPYLVQEKLWDGPQIKPFEYREGVPILQLAITKFSNEKCKIFLAEYYRQNNYKQYLFEDQ